MRKKKQLRSIFKSLPQIMGPMSEYSTKDISKQLIAEIKDVLRGLDYGSVEIYVQNGEVTQITKRHIKKTNSSLIRKRALTRRGK